MKPSLKITLFAVIISLSILIGFSVGKTFSRQAQKHRIESGQPMAYTQPNFNLVNPISDFIINNGLNSVPVKSFKSQIQQYIQQNKLKQRHIEVGYYFIDLNGGSSFGVNEQLPFAPASLMKVPTMIAVLQKAQGDPKILNHQLTYNAEDFKSLDEESGYPKPAKASYTIEQLLEQSICYSDNAATAMLMDWIGMDSVTAMEDRLHVHVPGNGSSETRFVGAKQYSEIFKLLYNCELLDENMSQKALQLMANAQYSKGLRSGIPAEVIVSHKYGKREMMDVQNVRHAIQLHDIGLVYYPHKPFVIALMTYGGTLEEKEKVISDLSKITFSEVDRQTKTSTKVAKTTQLSMITH